MSWRAVKSILVLLFCGALPGWAARPFMTDDARIATEGSCQLESWLRQAAVRSERWALPACNPWGRLELTAGAGRIKPEGSSAIDVSVLQAKTLFRILQPNNWAWGVAVGRVAHASAGLGTAPLGSTYLYVPLSLSTDDDRRVFHVNLGWNREHYSRRETATWGVGLEYGVYPRLMLMAETYGDERQKPWVQGGLRFSVVPGLLQVDATWGTQPGHPVRQPWTSLGIRYTPDKLF